MSTEAITPNEAVALVNALNDACNADDVERALAFFADDAVVKTLLPTVGAGSLGRKEQVCAFLQ